MNTPDLTNWATDMAAAGLEPYDGALTLDGDDAPLLRIHLAVSPDMSEDDRAGFLTELGRLVLRAL